MRANVVLAVFFFGLCGWREVVRAEPYTFSTINVPPGIETQVNGLNDSGQIVGSFLDNVHPYQGFVYDRGTFTVINVPEAFSTHINAINNSGQMVGWFGPPGQGFLYSSGVFMLI